MNLLGGEYLPEWFVAKITSVGTAGAPPDDGIPHGWTTMRPGDNFTKYYTDAYYPTIVGTTTNMPAYSLDGSAAAVNDIVLMRYRARPDGMPVMEFVKSAQGFTLDRTKKVVEEIQCNSSGQLWEISRLENSFLINGTDKVVVDDKPIYAIARRGCCSCGSGSTSGPESGSIGSCVTGECQDAIRFTFPNECDGLLCYPPNTLHMTVSNFRFCNPLSGSGSGISGSGLIESVVDGSAGSSTSGSVSGSVPCPQCQLPGSISMTLKCGKTYNTYFAIAETDYNLPFAAGGFATTQGVYRFISFGYYTSCYTLSMDLNLGQGTVTSGGITAITCDPLNVTGTIYGYHSNCYEDGTPFNRCVIADFAITE